MSINAKKSLCSPELQNAIGQEFEEYLDTLNLLKSETAPELKLSYYRALRVLQKTISNKIKVFGKCDPITSLQEICWMTQEKHEFNLTIPGQSAVEQEQQDLVDASQKVVQPIWRPNTSYYVRFRLKDEVDNGVSEGVFDYYYGFKTVGPVGHYHKHNEVSYVPSDANPDQYPLTSLRQYIDYNRSYPNADGNLLRAKPLFYGHHQCKINIYFTKPLTYHMLSRWPEYKGLGELEGNMHMAIKDPVTDVIIPYPLPADFDSELIPNSQTMATWIEVDWVEGTLPNNREIKVPNKLEVLDKNGEILGTFSVLFSEFRPISKKQHLRIGDEAELSENNAIVGGKVKWQSNGTDLEYTIIEIGKEDATWNVDNDPRVPINLQVINNMVNHVNANDDAIKCDLKIGDPIVPNSYSYNATLTNLKPGKLYTALLYNAFDINNSGSLEDTESTEVHQFVFQTSRYENFAEQVQSYWLQELDSAGNLLRERQAVFEIPLSLTIDDVQAALSIVKGTPNGIADALQLQYFDPFDRVTEGILGFKPLDPPSNTEFNVLKNTSNGKRVGILIRNPEPFNIPKIPLEEALGTISVVSGDSRDVDNSYKVLHSKDYSQALLMHISGGITADSLSFQFQYKTWNGSAYEINDTVITENIQLT